jgi:hypothetical protein
MLGLLGGVSRVLSRLMSCEMCFCMSRWRAEDVDNWRDWIGFA